MHLSRRTLALAPLTALVDVLARPSLAVAAASSACRDNHRRRQRAVLQGLRFIYRAARVAANFALHGDDFLWCFSTIANTAADPHVARLAHQMGRERAGLWRRQHRQVPADADVE